MASGDRYATTGRTSGKGLNVAEGRDTGRRHHRLSHTRSRASLSATDCDVPVLLRLQGSLSE
jgi:hypothetical protein